MRNKIYWGLGILIVLLIGAFVFVYVNEQSEIRQLESDLVEAQKKLEAHNKAANTPKVVDISDVKPPPAEPGFKWVRHGDHWDKIPEATTETMQEIPTKTELKKYWNGPIDQNGNPFPVNNKQSAELRRLRHYISMGVVPPPKGYDYLLIDNKEIVMDNGTPFLVRKDSHSTQYWITTSIGFAPSLQQYERYQVLQNKLKLAKNANDTNQIQQLSSEIETLTTEAQGRLPSLSGFGRADPHEYGTQAFEETHRQKKEVIRRAVHRHMGLEHILPKAPQTITIDGKVLTIVEDE